LNIFGKEKNVTKIVAFMNKSILVETSKTRWKSLEMTRKSLSH
jgi:hypothetical protein